MGIIIGLGIDLIDLEHFAIHYGDLDPELLERCFTAQEQVAVGDGADRLARLAARFAVKEATFKALGGASELSHLEIETVSSEGAPRVVLHGKALELAHARGVSELTMSITHSASSAAAVVIASAGPR
jgi:holo-[acyl-carrier protein] synthase